MGWNNADIECLIARNLHKKFDASFSYKYFVHLSWALEFKWQVTVIEIAEKDTRR